MQVVRCRGPYCSCVSLSMHACAGAAGGEWPAELGGDVFSPRGDHTKRLWKDMQALGEAHAGEGNPRGGGRWRDYWVPPPRLRALIVSLICPLQLQGVTDPDPCEAM